MSERCAGFGSSCKEHFLYQEWFWDPSWRAVAQSCWDVSLRDTPEPCRVIPLEMAAPAGTVTHRWPWRCPRDRARLGQGCADPDPAAQGLRACLWFGFLSHPAHSVFVCQITPGLGRACAALLTVVTQEVEFYSLWSHRRLNFSHYGHTGGWILLTVVTQEKLGLLWLWQIGQTWLSCLGQWVQTGFNIEKWTFDSTAWKGKKKEANSVLQYTQF